MQPEGVAVKRAALVLLLAAMAACQRPVRVDPGQLRAFAPLDSAMVSPDNPITPAKIALGRMLYYDTRLSADRTVSCNSCHALDAYGVDHRPVSLGIKQQQGGRNAPTVYHAAGQVAQFWDGRAPTVEEQAKGPVLNPVEMGMPSGTAVIARLRAVPAYRAAFARAFPDEPNPFTYDNLGKAIGAFERRLVTPARWDLFLAGNPTALTDDEKAGFNTFVAIGCQACHNGAYVGGASFQRIGLVEPWSKQDDLGRFAVTKNPSDRLVFKVPTLRNVTRTEPYFSDGQVATLPEAVRLMARHQLGRELSDEQTAAIITWLGSLTGNPPEQYIAPPTLPSGDQ
jgi:cytochrome c peroxidase